VERLQKFLARAGVASRREAESLISAGRVEVNGERVTTLGTRVDSGRDTVAVDGRQIAAPLVNVYFVIHKPRGIVTTSKDPWGRPTVLGLVNSERRLFPVGRLDADSEDVLILTDDGALANRLTHPRYGCPKRYRALVRGTPDIAALTTLRQGVPLEDGLTAPAEVEPEEPGPGGCRWITVTLREGRKRQVRRMLAHVGYPVERLIRIAIGPLQLGDLPLGASRPLTPVEVSELRTAVGSAP
jgi:23S rRNA pseudouridine2605 synthase